MIQENKFLKKGRYYPLSINCFVHARRIPNPRSIQNIGETATVLLLKIPAAQ